MTIQEFLEMSAGKWFSQRTSHQLASQQSEHSSSNIVVATLAADHPQLAVLHQKYPDYRHQTGIQVSAQAMPQWNAPKNTVLTSTTTVLLPSEEPGQNSQTGELLWMANGQPMPLGKFQVGVDQSLTLLLSYQSMQIEERIWFASDNLRLRTSVQKSTAGGSIASFCSEIRMGN
jgi:CpeS-like protein